VTTTPHCEFSAPNFQKYSAFYDLLYHDKDYAAEAEYVVQAIRSAAPNARSILELGSGTGRHGRLLAARGFEVHGIERSPEMVALARVGGWVPPAETGAFTCEIGDICSAKLGRTFDAIIALFHVMSYQTTNRALQAAFRTAASHLASGGLFLFDVWHGPAVLSQGLSERVKEVADERYRVRRTAQPELDTNRNTVKVVYQMEYEDRQSGKTVRFSEEHLMRYLFPPEVDLLAESCELRRVRTEEFLTGASPSASTWGVAYALQK
jgi:SAM-dependent methyltransferase